MNKKFILIIITFLMIFPFISPAHYIVGNVEDALDGESKEKFVKRVHKFFFEYLVNTNKKNILVVTHSGVIKVFLSITKKITLEEAFHIDIPYCYSIIYKDFKTQ